jgi:peptide deformylase
MHDAPGVGLAAPQVGLSIQLAVIEDRAESLRDLSAEQLAERERKPVPFHVLINPVIRSQSSETRSFYEGCLSVAGLVAIVPRARSIEVECLDEHAKPQRIRAQGWYARILQHEIGHLKGELYVDKMELNSLSTVDNFARHWKAKSIADAMKEFKRES